MNNSSRAILARACSRLASLQLFQSSPHLSDPEIALCVLGGPKPENFTIRFLVDTGLTIPLITRIDTNGIDPESEDLNYVTLFDADGAQIAIISPDIITGMIEQPDLKKPQPTLALAS